MTEFSFFQPSLDQAAANPQAVFAFPQVRFTLLNAQMLRVEISPAGRFEDRPTQAFWYRNQPLPQAIIKKDENTLQIKTDWFALQYVDSPDGFKRENLVFTLVYDGKSIHLDDENPGMLPGTVRTLDRVNGSTRLLPGFLSREGWTQLEDTNNLVFNEQGWLENRPLIDEYRDIYFLAYGLDYPSGLATYQAVGGRPPLLPRAFLGNWWSRYWAYTQEEIQALVRTFEQKHIPLSILIIDMDWHITDTGNACSGWTGFSWNRKLFPNPPGLMDWLHQRHLLSSLNLHPAEGIYPHEDRYPQATQAMGQNPDMQKPIPFQIANPKFVKTYFEEIIHPLEDDGVDFWWLDWQQGKRSKLQGLDPLWALNHLHFYDLGRDQSKRPIIFSRWGGAGNQRYPIGFSGDTYISWKSLDFQPFFTASAANVAYGWWSHDIGGHMHGMVDPDLYTRWVQLGVLSPIFRLHCSKDTFIEHTPWAFDAQVEENVRQAMQLRHALVPYLYSMSRRNEISGLPPVMPLYYEWPEDQSAYLAVNQYLFGSQLMAAPVTSPVIPKIGHSRHVIWFPNEAWFNFFTGEQQKRGWKITYQRQEALPLYARAGAIVPLQSDLTTNGCPNPEHLDLLVFPGADGQFDLYEDDGVSQQYLQTGGCTTHFSSHWQGNQMQIEIHPAEGDISTIPGQRNYRLLVRGIRQPEHIQIWIDGKAINLHSDYDADSRTLAIDPIILQHHQKLTGTIRTNQNTLIALPDFPEKTVRNFLLRCIMPTDSKHLIMENLASLCNDPALITQSKFKLNKAQQSALMELLSGCAAVNLNSPIVGDHLLLLNPHKLQGFTVNTEGKSTIVPKEMTISKSNAPITINYFGKLMKIK